MQNGPLSRAIFFSICRIFKRSLTLNCAHIGQRQTGHRSTQVVNMLHPQHSFRNFEHGNSLFQLLGLLLE